MGGHGSHRFPPSTKRTIHQERYRHRESIGIEESLAKGPGSGMRMLTYFINRAGRSLSTTRRGELQRAKSLLSRQIKEQKQRAA